MLAVSLKSIPRESAQLKVQERCIPSRRSASCYAFRIRKSFVFASRTGRTRMRRDFNFIATSIGACLILGSAQPSISQAVAYVYVANSVEITGYSAAADGRLTGIPKLRIDASVSYLFTTGNTVFGPGIDNKNIYS